MILTAVSGAITAAPAAGLATEVGLVAGQVFSVNIDTDGEALTLTIPDGLYLASGGLGYTDDGDVILCGQETLVFTADAGSYDLQLMNGQEAVGDPLSFIVSAKPEETPAQGGIQGALWLDSNDDGVCDAGEVPLPDYPVYLYRVSDPDPVQIVRTDMGGNYSFTNLAPGSYIVGIKPNELGAGRYLLPFVGIKNDNSFKVASDWMSVITNPLEITGDTVVTGIDAGMRNPMGIIPLALGDVSLTTFTVNGKSSETYNTYSYNVNQIEVGGVYQLLRDVSADAPATITVRLTNKDIEGYFGGAGSYNYFSCGHIIWPVGSAGQTVTYYPDYVEVSFLVSGTMASSGDFTIGFAFNAPIFGGWIPNGKLLAEITAGGDITGASTLTVTADVVDNSTFTFNGAFLSTGTEPTVMLDQVVSLSLQTIGRDRGNNTQWLREPGTDLIMELSHPENAVLVVPASPHYGYPLPMLGSSTSGGNTTIIWDFGQIESDGRPDMDYWASDASGYFYYYYQTHPITIKFPSTSFNDGDDITLTAKITYTLAGETVPKIIEITRTFKLVEHSDFIHMEPSDLQFAATTNSTITMEIDSDGTTNGNVAQICRVANNGGTLPIPETCYTWYNGIYGDTKKVNIDRIAITNLGTTFQTDIVYYIYKNGAYERKVEYTAAAANTAGGFTLVNSFITPGITPSAGIALNPGEYIEKIEFYPIDGSSGTRALPVGAGMQCTLRFVSWPGGVWPDGTEIEWGDVVQCRGELTWKGESYQSLYTDLSVFVDGTYDASYGGSTILMQTRDNDPYGAIHYGYSVIRPTVSLVYQAAQGAIYAPGDNVGVNLRFNNAFSTFSRWVDPVIYYIPPSYLTIDLSLNQALKVYLGNEEVPAAAVITETTLGGRTAYEIKVTGLSLAGGSTLYTIPLILTVQWGTPSGKYFLHNRADGVYPGSSVKYGLLFGTTEVKHSYVYPLNQNYNLLYEDINDLDDNASWWDGSDYTPYLWAVNSPQQLTVTALSKLDVSAEMYNDREGEWQSVNNPGAEATVSTDASGEGRFRLTLANLGNSYIGDISLLDILPHYDPLYEKLVLSGALKGSTWTATLKVAPTVTVYDADNNDVTPSFSGWSLRYSLQGDPSYNGGASGIQRSGTDGPFSGGTTFDAAAKSFLFSSGVFRLPPGHKLVIEGVVQAPDVVTETMVGSVAYNAFAVQAQYYQTNTIVTGQPATLFEPNKQKFILRDIGDASITKGGLVFKDLNGNSEYDDGTDVKYENVKVELWKADASGNPTGASPVGETWTDADGQYQFLALEAGDYVVKVIRPTDSPYDPYAFVDKDPENGSDTSHVDSLGLSSVIELSAGGTFDAPNAGIKATGRVTVRFYTISSGKEYVDSAPYSYLDVPIQDDTAAMTGNVTAGSGAGEYALPGHYHLAAGETNPKPYSVSWDVPTQTVEFKVEVNTNDITYAYTGTEPSGAATLLTGYDETDVPWNMSKTVKDNPSLPGYTFSGWDTDDAEVSDGSFNMPDNAVAFSGYWTVAEYAITYVLNGGTSDAGNPSSYNVEDSFPIDIGNPTRVGYTFTGWTVTYASAAHANITTPTTSFSIDALTDGVTTTGNITLTANWKSIPVASTTNTPSTSPRPTIIPTTPATTTTVATTAAVTTPVTTAPVVPTTSPTPTTSAVTPTTSEVPSTTPPTVSITTPTTVLTTTVSTTATTPPVSTTPAPNIVDDGGEWAVLNLVLCILGGLLAALAVIRAFFGGKEGRKASPLWVLLAVILGIVGFVVFFLTEDMSLAAGFVDMWTIVNVGILAAGFICVMLCFKTEKGENPRAERR